MEIADFKGEIRQNEPMSRHTSYGIGGPCDALAYPSDRDDLLALMKEVKDKGREYFILGGGTNLLVRDKGYRGVMISLKNMSALRIEREYRSIGGVFSVVYAEAGAALARLLSFAVDQGLTGLEFAAGIPGTVGGAICMNAGTADGEMGDIVDTVTLLSPSGEFIKSDREHMGFGYRMSSVPAGHAVLDVRVVLRQGDGQRIKARVKDIIERRRQHQPQGMPSAGSVFKNPQDESAGRLIELAGLKGKRIGNAQISERHANFIVNLGNAKAEDVIALMELVKQAVLDAHGVRLEPEIKIIGED